MKLAILSFVTALPALGAILPLHGASGGAPANFSLPSSALISSLRAATSTNGTTTTNGTVTVVNGANGTQITLPSNDTAPSDDPAPGILLVPSTTFMRHAEDVLANGTIPIFLHGTTPSNGTNGTYLLVPSTTFLSASDGTNSTAIPTNSTIPIYLNGTAPANGTEITMPTGDNTSSSYGTVIFVPASSFLGGGNATKLNGVEIPANGTVPVFFNGTKAFKGAHSAAKAAKVRAEFFQLH
ncbi:hypothetical protein HDZ31DRAFT_79894 [Schizophyllum fasciatum]